MEKMTDRGQQIADRSPVDIKITQLNDSLGSLLSIIETLYIQFKKTLLDMEDDVKKDSPQNKRMEESSLMEELHHIDEKIQSATESLENLHKRSQI